MKCKLDLKNRLHIEVEEKTLHKSSLFNKINFSDINYYPNLELRQIKTDITLGSYQLHQALGNLAEHKCKVYYQIMVSKESLTIGDYLVLYAQIQSRHSNSTKYAVYVK